MEEDRSSYKAFIHGSTLNLLVSLWTLICVSNFMLYFHLCPKTSNYNFEVFGHRVPPSIHASNPCEF